MTKYTLENVLLQMIAILKDEDESWPLKLVAIDAIGKIIDVENRLVPWALIHLVVLLKHEKWDVQFPALSAIGKIAPNIGDQDDNQWAKYTLEPLILLLDDENIDIVHEAIQAIGHIIENSIELEYKIVKKILNKLTDMQRADVDDYGQDLIEQALERIGERM